MHVNFVNSSFGEMDFSHTPNASVKNTWIYTTVQYIVTLETLPKAK